MGTKRAVGASLLVLMFFVVPVDRADTIISESGAGKFLKWEPTDLKNNGKPFWDNKSVDGTNRTQRITSNVGFQLTGKSDESPAPVPEDEQGPLPYWGKEGKAKKKTGGNADLNFYFQRNGLTNGAILTLEMDSLSNSVEFGWYDKADPSVKHPIILGSDSPSTDVITFSPTALQYGFYLMRTNQATFYTESRLNPFKDTSHQHFAVFQESADQGAEVYWIGIEDRTRRELKGKEGGLGDYNDMLIRIGIEYATPVPEPSTVVLVLSGALLTAWLRQRRR